MQKKSNDGEKGAGNLLPMRQFFGMLMRISSAPIEAAGEDMQSHMSIRFATEHDSSALLAVYAQYIETSVTFESPAPTQGAFLERIQGILRFYPYLVWEENGSILGYAYAHRYRERAAYDWDAELSIYLDRRAVSRGIGKKLYGALLELLMLQGVINAYGVVSTPNAGSEALHERLGFVRQCTHKNMGFKGGKWLDVTYYKMQLGPYTQEPAPVRPVWDLPEKQVQAIMEKYR